MYSPLRQLMFKLPAETAHHWALAGIAMAHQCKLSGLLAAAPVSDPRRVMGLEFAHAVGLAAGLDKNGEYIDGLAALGFSSIEVGTVTPLAQPGNPQPRLFRLPQAQAIINRMGFNNKGVDYLVEQVKRSRFRGILGINIGKNKDTPAERAVDDYLCCLRKVYPHASYITVNLSSPNTPGLRDLQFGEPLETMLDQLKTAQQQLSVEHGRYVPLAVKIAPDMADDDIAQVAQSLAKYRLDAVIATNTTIDRQAVQGLPHAEEAGGLSGAPLTAASTRVIAALAAQLDGQMPIIGVGGIMCASDAAAKIAAGASLVQLYTGFVYQGPPLIAQSAQAIAALRRG